MSDPQGFYYPDPCEGIAQIALISKRRLASLQRPDFGVRPKEFALCAEFSKSGRMPGSMELVSVTDIDDAFDALMCNAEWKAARFVNAFFFENRSDIGPIVLGLKRAALAPEWRGDTVSNWLLIGSSWRDALPEIREFSFCSAYVPLTVFIITAGGIADTELASVRRELEHSAPAGSPRFVEALVGIRAEAGRQLMKEWSSLRDSSSKTLQTATGITRSESRHVSVVGRDHDDLLILRPRGGCILSPTGKVERPLCTHSSLSEAEELKIATTMLRDPQLPEELRPGLFEFQAIAEQREREREQRERERERIAMLRRADCYCHHKLATHLCVVGADSDEQRAGVDSDEAAAAAAGAKFVSLAKRRD